MFITAELLTVAAIAVGLAVLWSAFAVGSMAAEVRFLRRDAARYAALRRCTVTDGNGRPLAPHKLDRICDEMVLRDAIERNMRPND